MPQILVYFDNTKNFTLTMCEVIERSKSLNTSSTFDDISSSECNVAVNPDSLKVLILIGTLIMVIISIALFTLKFLGKMAVHSMKKVILIIISYFTCVLFLLFQPRGCL